MKIVNLEEFRALPAATVFFEYEPCYFSGLAIKAETGEHSCLYQDLIGNVDSDSSVDFFFKLRAAQECGTSCELDFHCNDRDGLHDKEQLFAVYESRDLDGLIDRLVKAREDLKAARHE